MMETVNREDLGGKHRQTDLTAPERAIDETPTEALPATGRTPGVVNGRRRAAAPDSAVRDRVNGSRSRPTTAFDGSDPAGQDGPEGRSDGAECAKGPVTAVAELVEPDPAEPHADLDAADADPAEMDATDRDATSPGGAEVDVEDADDLAPADLDRADPPREVGAPVEQATIEPVRRVQRGIRGRVVVGAVVLAVIGLGAWLAYALLGAGGGTKPVSAPAAAAAVAQAPEPAAFGAQVGAPDGWTVKIDEPSPYRPGSGTTLPADADRAVQLQVTLTNVGDRSRDTAGWAIKATADSRAVDLLPAEGRPLDAVPSRTVLPGSSLTFRVAVPLPTGEVDLQMEAINLRQPPVVYVGSA